MSRPCVFFDRDGIVNRAPLKTRYVERWSDFYLLPEFVEVLRVIRGKGYEAVVVTNQKGIGAGHISIDTVEEIHGNLLKELESNGVGLLDILVSPDTDDNAPRRKPNPGMLLEAAEKHDLDLKRSWMVGDQKKDIEAGRRVGCKTVFVGPSGWATGADYEVAAVSELETFFLKHL